VVSSEYIASRTNELEEAHPEVYWRRATASPAVVVPGCSGSLAASSTDGQRLADRSRYVFSWGVSLCNDECNNAPYCI